jgi:hypothetical protein
MEIFGDESDWQARTGYVPLIQAEQRLRNLRRVARSVLDLRSDAMSDLRAGRDEYLELVSRDPSAATYLYEAREVADGELLSARDELTVLLLGSLIAYSFSLLESALGGCADTAAAILGLPPPSQIGNPKLNRWIAYLQDDCKLDIAWEPLEKDLDFWRHIRNSYIHQLEIGPAGQRPDGPSDKAYDWERFGELLDLVADALRVLDEAMAQL